MKVARRFTTAGKDVFASVEWTTRTSRITNADGSVVFEMNDAEVPASWSQLATDIMVSKYFRKAGVPQTDDAGRVVRDGDGKAISGPERSARQVIHRLAHCWRHWGEKHGYFDTADDAQAFYDELAWMMLTQAAAPNSPQWFNTGLNLAYGISGPPQGHWITDPATGRQTLAGDAYSHPQPHACFIQAVNDDLVNEGGIMDLWVREARLFKYGSGTGTNFSRLRAENEPLSGGGKSSGLMSFLKIGDRAAGAIKSGGTTRRAAKMVCLDADHPDIEAFVNWKVREELKVAAMVEGLRHMGPEHHDVAKRLGLELSYDFNGEAYYTVSGQNSNNSVRLNDAFFKAVDEDGDWVLTGRTDGSPVRTIKARELWDQICFAAWRCADPGLQYDSTINAWHTCPSSGRINASNPCSEYMFLDNTACNLASLNLLEFFDEESRTFDVAGYEHAIDLWTIVLEVSVLMAAFPSREIARESYRFRTLGLGYANLGAMLMRAGIAYDSDEGRAICGAMSAILTGRAYATSARMAAALGPFPAYQENAESMLRVIRNHRRAAQGIARDAQDYEDLHIRPVPIDHGVLRSCRRLSNASTILDRAVRAWDDALNDGSRHGYRNAQVTVIAPTGTIGLLMDCDTTGVEPDFALVKFKKLAGGGYFKIANASLRPALKALGYVPEQVDDIVAHVMGRLTIDVPMPESHPGDARTFRAFLESKGYSSDDLVPLENGLPAVFDLAFAFNAYALPDSVMKTLGIDPAVARADSSFNGLAAMGLSDQKIAALNQAICGTQTIEGAPHLRDEHLPVFDCANRCGPKGRRFIAPKGHIRMMAAAQPFISGAISKTINLPREATEDDIANAYRLSWELGLKANALYRDGSKLSQPLNTSSSDTLDEDEDEDAVAEAIDEVADDVIAAANATTAAGVTANRLAHDDDDDEHDHDDHEEQVVERIVERIIERPMRRRLPDTRHSITHRFNVAGHEGYLTVGLYPDEQTPGELFITMSKEGSTIGGLMDSLGTAISVALQYGVPIESLVNKFAHQRFEPMGMTTNPDVPFAKSLVDYIFRWLGMEFIPGYREANAPRRSTKPAAKPASNPGPKKVMEDDRWPKRPAGGERASINASTAVRSEGEPTGANGHGKPAHGAPGHSIPTPPANGGVREKTADMAGPTSGTGSATAVAVGAVVVGRSAGGAADAITDSATAETGMRIAPSFASRSALDTANADLQTDAPACDVCGSITVRNGTCYKCLNCGNSMGCS